MMVWKRINYLSIMSVLNGISLSYRCAPWLDYGSAEGKAEQRLQEQRQQTANTG